MGDGGAGRREVEWEEVVARGLTVLEGVAYDLQPWASHHPGGSAVIHTLCGRDGTTSFAQIHSADILAELPGTARVGKVVGVSPASPPSPRIGALPTPTTPGHSLGAATAPATAAATASSTATNSSALAPDPRPSASHAVSTLETVLCLDDVERAAAAVLPATAYAYFATGAGAERTLRANTAAFRTVDLIPRILVDVSKASTRCTLLGHPLKLPLFVSAAARGKLAHPTGEAGIARGCAVGGVLQMVPQLGGSTLEEVAAAGGQSPRWLQLYVFTDRSKTLALIRRAEALGYTALVITVDAPTVGKRIRDIRAKLEAAGPTDSPAALLGSAPRSGSSAFDERLSWDDLRWFQSVSRLPVLLKGVQCGADAVAARRHGMAGVVVSNHGGRNLDGCRPTLAILAEVTAALRRDQAESTSWTSGSTERPHPAASETRAADPPKFEVLLDGGVREGGDIIKALALGATAVGIGRPAIYGLAAFGPAGVAKVIDLLQSELLTAMKLMGVPTIQGLNKDCLSLPPRDSQRSML